MELSRPELPATYRRDGYLALREALDPGICRNTIGSLTGASMIEVESSNLRGTTRFLTLNGNELIQRAPWLMDAYRSFADTLSQLTSDTYLPLDNLRVGLSLNYTLPGGSFVPHFDRNAITVSLYLNEVAHGELSIWPNIVSPLLDLAGKYKLPLALRLSRFRPPIDIPPRVGTLVVFSRRTVHSVAPVSGSKARVSVIMAFDRPGVSFAHVPDYYGVGTKRVVLGAVDA
jgi:hypothetical protein